MKKIFLLLAAALTFGAANAQKTAELVFADANGNAVDNGGTLTLAEDVTSTTKNFLQMHAVHPGYTLMAYFYSFTVSDNITITGALTGDDAKVYDEDSEETYTATPNTGGGDGHTGTYNVAGVFLTGNAFTANSTLATDASYVFRLRFTVTDDFTNGNISVTGYLTDSDNKDTYMDGARSVNVVKAGTEPTAIDDVNANKTVASQRYFNIAGVEMNEAAQGVNIVVTTYTDGTTSTAKVLK